MQHTTIRRTVLWTTCALSGLPLVPPIMADALGQLYNKQAVLEHLLAAKAAAAAASSAPAPAAAPLAIAGASEPTASSVEPSAAAATGSIVAYSKPAATAASKPDASLAAACLRYDNQQRAAAAAAAGAGGGNSSNGAAQGTFDHIRSLSKDVFLVQLTANPDLQPSTTEFPCSMSATVLSASHNGISTNSSSLGDLPSPWVCPVTHLPCGGKQPCVALRPCGHVLSRKALAAIIAGKPSKGGKVAATGSNGQHSEQQGAAAAAGGGTQQPDDDDDVEDLSCSDVCCCPVCEAPFDPSTDQVLVNGSQQHMDAVRVQLQEAAEKKAQAKQQKKKRKRAEANAQKQSEEAPSCG